MTASPWRLEGRTAVLDAASLAGVLDLDRPDLGMTSLKVGDTPLDGNLWALAGEDRSQNRPAEQVPPPRVDTYTRGGDLIVTYGPTDDRPFETQLYWSVPHATDAQGASQLSLLLSIRTHLLDTEPVICVTSQRPAPADEQDASVVWQRVSNDQLWLAEACDPTDQTERVGDLAQGEVGWELFSHFLEKGVIRRARLMIAISDQRELVHDSHKRFLAAPLPLTT